MSEHKRPPTKPNVAAHDEKLDDDLAEETHDEDDESEHSRGAAVTAAGTKVHGDKLDGVIPKGSEAERANGRPTRDDGDNDDPGALGAEDNDRYIGKRH
jgi:hypothetical protein